MKNDNKKLKIKLHVGAKQLYFGLIGLIAVLLIVGLIGFYVLQKQLGNRVASLQKVSAQVVLENDQINRLKKLQADYQTIEPLANQLQAVLPPQKDQAQIIAQISAIVQGSGLNLSGLTFNTTEGLPSDKSQTLAATGVTGIFIIPVKFETTGTYDQIEALLNSFESQQRFMRVSILDITRNDQGTLDTNFTLEVFFKP